MRSGNGKACTTKLTSKEKRGNADRNAEMQGRIEQNDCHEEDKKTDKFADRVLEFDKRERVKMQGRTRVNEVS